MGHHRDYAAFLGKSAAARCALETKEAAPDLSKIAELVEGIGKTFEEYKSTNDQRLKEVEAKGGADPVTEEKLARMDEHLSVLDGLKKDLEKLEADFERRRSSGDERKGTETPEALAHKSAFLAFLRDPADHQRSSEAKAAAKAHAKALGFEGKAVDTLTGGAGGHGVPEILSRDINARIREISEMRRLVKVVSAGSSDYKELLDTLGQGYGWVGETDTRSETGTSVLEEIAPTFGTIYAYPKASEESLQDIFFDVEAWIASSAIEGFTEGEGAAVIAGNGSNKPTGFLNGTPVTTADATRAFGVLQYVPSGAAGALTDPDVLITLAYAAKKQYRRNATWVMNSPTTAIVRKLKDGDGNYIWQPGLRLGEPASMLGYAVECMEDMPDVAANAFPIGFGDFRKGYVLVDVAGLRLTRDEVTEPGYVKWYIRRRLGGRVLDSNAIKLVKIATS